MEVAGLIGLLGLGYGVSKISKNKPTNPQVNAAVPPNRNPPYDKSYPLFSEGFAPQGSRKGASAVGFGPELDMMYQQPNGQTYPSEPSNGPYGTAFGYASNKPPLAPMTNRSGTRPHQSPIDSNVPMVEYRSDNTESPSSYIDADYIISPLSGERIPSGEYKHNNMQPFFGGRMKQNMSAHANTGVLDAYNGMGSTQMKKQEVENMFETSRAPFGNPFGMEDNTDFFQSRINAPNARNGELPFEPTKVGAGLGERFGFAGKGGFQQLEINEIMRPKDTNDLRVLSNPKETYDQPVVPGQHFIGTNSYDAGEVRKYKPDTFFLNESGERNFVTTGDLIKETVRSTQVLPHTTRPETSVQYEGIASSQDFGEGYVTGSYRMPMGQQYGGAGYRNADMTSYFTKQMGESDYGKSSIEIRPNERNETSERVMALNTAPADNQLVTNHYTDDARPTRRGETIGNIRMTGTPVKYGDRAPAITVWDPSDIARTTVKESTIYLDRPGIAGGDGASATNRLKVYDPEDIARSTQKAQLSNGLAWTGPGGNGAWSDAMDTTFASNMRSNPNKEQIARGRKPIAGSGSTATFNGNPGKQLSKKLDADIMNDRPLAVNRSLDLTSGVGDIGRMEYRVPLKLDVSRERNTYDSIQAVDNNPLMQSLRKNAEKDEAAIRDYKQYLSAH